jgi:hypothetical protein
VLAYCAFQHAAELSLPSAGVQGALVQVIAAGELRLLWSQVEWPFAADRVQKHAVEFHGVVDHIFKQAAVVPFRLLSIFDDEAAMSTFIAENHSQFLADLERLKHFVQMECVIYPVPAVMRADTSSGTAYLQRKAVALRSAEGFVQGVREAVAHLGNEVRVRQTKTGHRIFVLVQRGRENDFRQVVSALAIPEHLSRRIGGPWPAAEFLSEAVKSPQITPAAGAK